MKNLYLFTERLKAARDAAGVSQEQLAASVGVGRDTILNWEKGRREPTLSFLGALADTLNVSVAYLSGEDNAQAPIVEFVDVPIVERCFSACCGNGFPNSDTIAANAQERIQLPATVVGSVSVDSDTKPYVIYAEGDSMSEAGISDGSMVVVNPIEPVMNGDAALVEFVANPTLSRDLFLAIKRIYWLDGGVIELRSADRTGWFRRFSIEEERDGMVRVIGKVMCSITRPKRG